MNKITYTLRGDYLIPDLTVPKAEPVGMYGRVCAEYLRKNRHTFYSTLLMTGKLSDYLTDIDRQAEELKNTLLPKYKKQYGITEQLKAVNQMEWVRLMNTIAHIIDEIIYTDVIYGGI